MFTFTFLPLLRYTVPDPQYIRTCFVISIVVVFLQNALFVLLVSCVVVQDCEMQLTDEPAQRCYPLDGHLLCRACHLQRISVTFATTNNN